MCSNHATGTGAEGPRDGDHRWMEPASAAWRGSVRLSQLPGDGRGHLHPRSRHHQDQVLYVQAALPGWWLIQSQAGVAK
jgi:hypothetical protein